MPRIAEIGEELFADCRYVQTTCLGACFALPFSRELMSVHRLLRNIQTRCEIEELHIQFR